jgi:hypothetical protein
MFFALSFFLLFFPFFPGFAKVGVMGHEQEGIAFYRRIGEIRPDHAIRFDPLRQRGTSFSRRARGK